MISTVRGDADHYLAARWNLWYCTNGMRFDSGLKE
jgi:hypothetical protein